jgi:hypothetical protein
LVRWPGENGGSLIDHINIISSVSGGSLAAAYFALNCPEAAGEVRFANKRGHTA